MIDKIDSVIAKERERLIKRRTECLREQKRISASLAAIEMELRAIAAYEAAKTRQTSGPEKRDRAPRGSRSGAIIGLLKNRSLTRAQIIEALGATDKKSIQGSISNALTIMKRKGRINYNKKMRTYSAV